MAKWKGNNCIKWKKQNMGGKKRRKRNKVHEDTWTMRKKWGERKETSKEHEEGELQTKSYPVVTVY